MLDPSLVSVASGAKPNSDIRNLAMDTIPCQNLICINKEESVRVDFLLV